MNEYQRQDLVAFLRALRDVVIVVAVMAFMAALALLGWYLFSQGNGWWIACATGFVVTFIVVMAFARMDMYQ